MDFETFLQQRVGAISCFPGSLYNALKSLDDCSIDEVLIPGYLAKESWLSDHENREMRRVARCCHRGSDAALRQYIVDDHGHWISQLAEVYWTGGTFLLAGLDLGVSRQIASVMSEQNTVIIPTGLSGPSHIEFVQHMQRHVEIASA